MYLVDIWTAEYDEDGCDDGIIAVDLDNRDRRIINDRHRHSVIQYRHDRPGCGLQ
jgi:hypothetical protein